MIEELIKKSDALIECEGLTPVECKAMQKRIKSIPAVEPNLILPERMERGDCYEVGETIVVMNHDDYYDLLCKSMENEPKQGEWERIPYSFAWGFRCSCCGTKARDNYWNYCANCGARMKGTDDE